MIPLHVHSHYSLLEGTSSIDELINKAKQFRLHAIALTDTNGMYGLIEFAKKADEANIKPILGAYITGSQQENVYALLLAKNIEGYSDICKIITTKKLKGDFSLIKLLQNELKNLFIVTSSLELLRKIPLRENIHAELISTKKMKSNTRTLYSFAQENKIKHIPTNPVYFCDKENYLLNKVVKAIKDRTTIENVNEGNCVDKEFYFEKSADAF